MNGLAKQARGAMETALILIGNEARNHFVDSFKKQGFEDKAVQKWIPRKKQDKRAGRAILVKSGDLRRSIIRGAISKTALSVKIKTDLKYAHIHNFGGVINKKSRTAILSFNKKGGFAKQRTEKQRAKTSYQQKAEIGAHSVVMPKRQFVGDSYNLNEKVKKIVVNKLDSLFKK